MHLSKARYVTFCQQSLALACVFALATATAGVLNLDIVGRAPGAPDAGDVAPAVTVGDAYVATKPVAPKVHEVAVRGVAHKQSTTRSAPASKPAGSHTPKQSFRLAALSSPERATGMATVGATWDLSDHFAENQIKLAVRTLKHGTWSTWSKLQYHDDHGPDAGTAESRHVRAGTDPTVVGYVDSVQLRAETRTGRAPRGLRLALVDPGADLVRKAAPAISTAKLPTPKSAVSGTATSSQATDGGSIALSSMKVAPKPYIYSRAQWGADEHIRESGNPLYGTIKTGFVHHTVNANNYTAAQVPALIRGIYAYHVEANGWRDIGYNFLVDRFGKIWEGRFGGVDKAVVGAHTLGYNEVSFAMSAIGNYDIVAPPQAVLNAFASLFAWKLSTYNIKADATHLWVKNRYLNAIDGHRDVYSTACPGKYLYAKIPAIRAVAANIQTAAGTQTPTPTPSPTPTPTPTPRPTPTPTPTPNPIFSFDRVAGQNRYETSAVAAKVYGSASNAILANGEQGHFPDALTASYLSGSLKAPVLLTTRDTTPKAILDQLKASHVRTVTVVGDTNAVSAQQAIDLGSAGYTVNRIGGANRYDTAEAVIKAVPGNTHTTGVLATGQNFPDALGAGPLAYAKHFPLAITRPDRLPAQTLAALKAAGVTQVIIAGAQTAVSHAVVDELAKNKITVLFRADGTDRVDTAAKLARYAVTKYGFSSSRVNVASGQDGLGGADALSGAPVSGKENRPMLITSSTADTTGAELTKYLTDNAKTLRGTDNHLFGGPGSVARVIK